jgi:Relaxase/Mobilisation nuclease domain
MPKRIVELRAQVPILDIASYGRRGPGGPTALTNAQIEQVARTVRHVPEVIIKVSGGARSLRGVGTHLDYIGREGEGVVESDDGVLHQEKGFEKAILEDWDLDLEEHRRHTQRAVATGRKPPKLVHNLVFSMPKGTPPDKLHAAVRKFATEKFALQHRYAMAMHTDQGHPHLHVVVKAVSEQGERLNIRKATVALHVNLDKTSELRRETFTAQAALVNRCWLVVLRSARAAAIRRARSFRTSSGCPLCHVAGVM